MAALSTPSVPREGEGGGAPAGSLRGGRRRALRPPTAGSTRDVAGGGAGARAPVTLAAAHAFGRCAAAAERALAAARRGTVAGIHDVRTATRRARAALDAFADELERGERRAMRRALRALRRAASALRDLDVLREAIAGARLPAALEAGRGALLAALARRRRAGLAAFSGATAGRSQDAVAATLHRLAARLADTASALPFAVAGAARLPAALAPALAQRARLGGDPVDAPAPELHALRIAVKRARYAAESFAPAFGRPLLRFGLDARRLQDRLGALQDAEANRAGLVALLPLVPLARNARRAATTTATQLGAAFDRDAEQARGDVPGLLEAALGPRALRALFAHLGKRAAIASTAGVARRGRGPR